MFDQPKPAPQTHYIRFFPAGGRDGWECSCGHGGSTGTSYAGIDVEIAAERHIPEGDHMVYRHGSER